MIKCSSCESEAVYRYKVTGDYSLVFCVPCLPAFLKAPQYRGRVVKLSKEETPTIVVEEAPKKKSTKKKVEEPVVEEPVVEDVVEEPVLDESTETPVEEADGLN